MPDPDSSPVQPKLQVWAVSAKGGAPPTLVAEGDEPAISRRRRARGVREGPPRLDRADGRVEAGRRRSSRKGSGESPVWSPNGSALAFVSDREDHSFIAIFNGFERPLRYLAPSTSRDVEPRWSLDGREIAFVRLPGRGGAPRSPLVQQPQPWAIWVAETEVPDRKERPEPAARSVEERRGARRFAAAHRRQPDARMGRRRSPGLHVVPGRLAAPLLDPASRRRRQGRAADARRVHGRERVAAPADRRSIVYNANTGADKDDIDRRHLYRVPVAGGSPVALTSGHGIEWTPVATGRWRLHRVPRIRRATARRCRW